MKTSILAFALDTLASLLLVTLALLGYHRYVVQPALRIGVVDLAEVYRAKEAEFTQALTRADAPDARDKALQMAGDFARKLPRALEELPRECQCLVVLRSAVAGVHGRSVDLTPLLRNKLEMP
ncbi:hypothetical protein O4H66_15320 [Comamonadaceae bacterium G21597-S1]|nr:hypothetical protein [Comamonadaceae bacterium G21597-S1]